MVVADVGMDVVDWTVVVSDVTLPMLVVGRKGGIVLSVV